MRRVLIIPDEFQRRSWYSDLPPGEQNFAVAYQTAHVKAGYHRWIDSAAAGLWTTPTDLLKATAAVQDSLYTDHGFVSQHTAKKMLAHVSEMDGQDPSISMGWFTNEKTFAHSGGNDPGYRTYVFGFKDSSLESAELTSSAKHQKGIAVMTNSVVGYDVAVRQIVSALFYLKSWDRIEKLPLLFDDDDDFAPYTAPEGTQIDGGWREWSGKWEQGYQIVDDNGPSLVFRTLKPMKLTMAASPNSAVTGDKPEFVLTVDGLKLGIRLTWHEGRRVMILLKESSKRLEKIES